MQLRLWFIIQNSKLNTVRSGGLILFSLMLSTLKGHFSSILLAGKSNYAVSNASLYTALVLASSIALLSGLFAFIQWRVGESLFEKQQEWSRVVEQRVTTHANMGNQQANAHRATLNILLSRDKKEFDEAEALRISNLHDYLESSSLIGASDGLLAATEEVRLFTEQYKALSAQVVDLFRKDQKEEAHDLRVSRLRVAFNHWQKAHANFSTKLADTVSEQNKDHKLAYANTRRWLAGLLIAPLVFMMLGIMTIVGMFGVERLRTKVPDPWSR